MHGSREDFAWAAGLFEGEGSIIPTTKNGAQLVLGMCDRDVVDRFAAICGCGTIYVQQRRNPKHSDAHRWVASRRFEVEDVLLALMPWFGDRRAAKAAEILKRVANNLGPGKDKTHCKHGHAYTSENTRINHGGGRACRACEKIRNAARYANSPASVQILKVL